MDDKALTRKEAISAYQKLWWANRPYHQRKAALNRMRKYSKTRNENRTPDEREAIRLYSNEWYANKPMEKKIEDRVKDNARYANRTPEQIADREEKYANRTPEQVERKNELQRKWQANRTREQVEAYRLVTKERLANRTPEQITHRKEYQRKWQAMNYKNKMRKKNKGSIKICLSFISKRTIKYIQQVYRYGIEYVKTMRNSNGRRR